MVCLVLYTGYTEKLFEIFYHGPPLYSRYLKKKVENRVVNQNNSRNRELVCSQFEVTNINTMNLIIGVEYVM